MAADDALVGLRALPEVLAVDGAQVRPADRRGAGRHDDLAVAGARVGHLAQVDLAVPWQKRCVHGGDSSSSVVRVVVAPEHRTGRRRGFSGRRRTAGCRGVRRHDDVRAQQALALHPDLLQHPPRPGVLRPARRLDPRQTRRPERELQDGRGRLGRESGTPPVPPQRVAQFTAGVLPAPHGQTHAAHQVRVGPVVEDDGPRPGVRRAVVPRRPHGVGDEAPGVLGRVRSPRDEPAHLGVAGVPVHGLLVAGRERPQPQPGRREFLHATSAAQTPRVVHPLSRAGTPAGRCGGRRPPPWPRSARNPPAATPRSRGRSPAPDRP